MNQIPCCNWLPEQANPLGIAHFVPTIKFCRSLSGCTKVFFLLQNIFCDSKEIFCDFSVRMELENKKTESVNENENKENKNVDEFQEYILQHKSENTKIKTQRDTKEWKFI